MSGSKHRLAAATLLAIGLVTAAVALFIDLRVFFLTCLALVLLRRADWHGDRAMESLGS